MIGNPELSLAIVKENLLKDTPWNFDAMGQAVVQDALREVLSLISSTKEGWQPIETAPKDGTLILVARAGKDSVFSAWWQDGTAFRGGNGAGWVDGATDRYEDHIVYEGITHWQPLPASPSPKLDPNTPSEVTE